MSLRVLASYDQLILLAGVNGVRGIFPVVGTIEPHIDQAERIIKAGGSPGRIPCTGQHQTVCIADSGFDRSSREDVPSPFQKRIGDIDAFDGDGKIIKSHDEPVVSLGFDSTGHGTRVAGSIAASGRYRGQPMISPGSSATLIIQKMIHGHGGNSLPPISGLLRRAFSLDARIHSNSWGMTINAAGAGVYDQHAIEVDKFIYDHPTMVVIFSAGNNRRTIAHPPSYQPDEKLSQASTSPGSDQLNSTVKKQYRCGC